MKQLNTLPIEDYLEKTRIAIKSNQKSVTLTIKEATDLQNSLSIVMTRLAGNFEQKMAENQFPDKIEIKVDGGKFQGPAKYIRTFRRTYIMSRPKPKVLLEITNKKSYKTDQVLESDAIWAVFYIDKPINLKTTSVVAQQLGPKYKKVSFSNSGHAFNLAEKLNKLFNTTDFAVYKLTTGEKVTDESET